MYADMEEVNEVDCVEPKKIELQQNEQDESQQTDHKLLKLPLSRIKTIIKMDPDVSITSHEAAVILARATELFISIVSRDATVRTLQAKRKTLLKKDVESVLETRDSMASKTLRKIQTPVEVGTIQGQNLVAEMVCSYISACDTTKVARDWEKVLTSTGPQCQDFIRTKLLDQILDIIKTPEPQNLKKVSTILEHSRLIQDMAAELQFHLCALLSRLFTDLIFTQHDSFSKTDEEQLYCTVKLSLQVFQLFPEIKQCILDIIVRGNCDSSAGLQCSVATMIQGILNILMKKTFSRDTTLLAGTTVAMMISVFPLHHQVVQHFIDVYETVSQGLSVIKIGHLKFDNFLGIAALQRDLGGTGASCLSEIALLRSTIMMSNSDVLVCATGPTMLKLNKNQSDSPKPFILWLFPAICELCDGGAELKYLSFQLLSLWYRKLLICFPRLEEVNLDLRITHKDSTFLQETIKRIWTNWDSPIEGVAEFVTETFRMLLEIWDQEIREKHCDNKDFANELVAKLVEMPWHSRSRYKPFSLLIPYVDTELLLCQYENLKLELLHCMATSYMAALATDVYSAFITSIRRKWPEEMQLLKWQEIWMTTVISGVTSDDCVLRSKVCAYWLPWSLKILPDSGTLLYDHFLQKLEKRDDNSNKSLTLFAWVTVCRHIRMLKEIDLNLVPDNLLTEALFSCDEDICSEAVAVLCTTQKKAEPLSWKESSHLCAVLPFCLKVDSAPFRQQLTTSLRKLFVRIRDSCLMAVRKKMKTDFLDISLEFIDWLYQSLILSLFPGACFQRRRTCLDIIQAWLETIVFVESDGAKKGKAKGPTTDLIAYAQLKGLWNFFSFETATSLLCCITDGADEIQETALHILMKYYPWEKEGQLHVPLSESLAGIDEFACHLLACGLEMCRSPRAYETRSGASLVRLVYSKFVKNQGFRFTSQQMSDFKSGLRVLDKGPSQESSIAFFSDILLELIESSLQKATKDALVASQCNPIHGMMQALCQCVHIEACKPVRVLSADWKHVLLMAVALSTGVISLMLQVLAGDQSTSAGSCPSFAEMGSALELLLVEGQSEQEVTSSFSPEFQLLLSWCWLNLKESCTCLGEVVAASITQGRSENLISVEEIQAIGQTFLKVLTGCRHRGAIEGCKSGFLQFCVALMSSQNEVLCKLPAMILNQLLCNLESDEMTSSITRRSAGLPVIVQTVVQAERRCKSDKLLQATVSRLYAVASSTPHEQALQTHDQAAVHAFNILKAIFSDSSLAGELFSHLGQMMQLVIGCFESPSWAIRNAATQLVSTLVTRMFGQRNKASLSCNMMTLQEFSAHFPELLDFVKKKLDAWLVQGERITEIQPSMFLVLTILASLGPSGEDSLEESVMAEIRNKVSLAMSNPVYYLRELSATAVVALTPLHNTDVCIQEQLVRIQVHSGQKQNCNRIHGILLCLEKLLASRTVSAGAVECITQFILENQWVLQSVYPMVSAKCVNVLHLATNHLPEESLLRQQAVQSLLNVVFPPPAQRQQIGQSTLTANAVSCLHDLCCGGHTSLSAQDFCFRCLQSEDADVRRAVLQSISSQHWRYLHAVNPVFESALWKSLENERDHVCIMEATNLLVANHLHHSGNKSSIPANFDLHYLRSKFQKMSRIQASLFPVEALVLAKQLNSSCNTDCEISADMVLNISDWSQRLKAYSHPFQSEDYRMAAAQGLCFVGPSILKCHHPTQRTCLDSAVVFMMDACLRLLEETDIDIRKVATQFVGSLQWDGKTPRMSSINSNMCFKVFLEYIREEKGHSRAVQEFFLSKLYSPGALTSYIKKQQQPRILYLFEPEENTFFAEKVILQLQIFQMLMELCTKGANFGRSYPSSTLEILVEELQFCVTSLAEIVSGRPIFNVLGEAGLVDLLVGLVLQARVLNQCIDHHPSAQSANSTELSAKFLVQLGELLKIPQFHPAVKSFLQWIGDTSDFKYFHLKDSAII